MHILQNQGIPDITNAVTKVKKLTLIQQYLIYRLYSNIILPIVSLMSFIEKIFPAPGSNSRSYTRFSNHVFYSRTVSQPFKTGIL